MEHNFTLNFATQPPKVRNPLLIIDFYKAMQCNCSSKYKNLERLKTTWILVTSLWSSYLMKLLLFEVVKEQFT